MQSAGMAAGSAASGGGNYANMMSNYDYSSHEAIPKVQSSTYKVSLANTTGR